MRNLSEYPITTAEIEACLLRLSEESSSQGRIGDMRPLLLREAAKIVANAGQAEQPDSGVVADLVAEVAKLRAALEPFARCALTREGQSNAVPDSTPVTVMLGECRNAQRTMAA